MYYFVTFSNEWVREAIVVIEALGANYYTFIVSISDSLKYCNRFSGTTTDTVTVNAKNKSKITNTPPESTKSSKMVPDVIFDGLDTASIVNMESTVLPSLMMEKLIDESTEVTISSVLEND